MLDQCHEGVAFLGGLSAHFAFDLIAVPLLVALGWRLHGNRDGCSHGSWTARLRRLIGKRNVKGSAGHGEARQIGTCTIRDHNTPYGQSACNGYPRVDCPHLFDNNYCATHHKHGDDDAHADSCPSVFCTRCKD